MIDRDSVLEEAADLIDRMGEPGAARAIRALKGQPAASLPATSSEAAQAAFKRLLAAAKVYSFNYMQDEAENVEDCVCGPKQHAEAKEVFAAIEEVEGALKASAATAGGAKP